MTSFRVRTPGCVDRIKFGSGVESADGANDGSSNEELEGFADSGKDGGREGYALSAVKGDVDSKCNR